MRRSPLKLTSKRVKDPLRSRSKKRVNVMLNVCLCSHFVMHTKDVVVDVRLSFDDPSSARELQLLS